MSPRRNIELGLLVLATLVIVGAYLLVSAAEDSDVPYSVGPFLGVIIGVQLVGHITLRKVAPDADSILLPLASLLNGLGYVFIVRLDEDLAGLQATWAMLGMGAFVGTLVVVRQTRVLESYRYTAGLLGIALLLLPLVPGLGQDIKGSRIWVNIGPVNFQPGEFAKLALAVFFAGYLYEKRELLAISRAFGPISLPDPRHVGPLLLAWGAAMVVMVYQTDIGTALLFFTLFVVLIWVSTGRVSYLVVSTLMFFGGAWFALSHFRHARTRIDQWGGFGSELASPTDQLSTQLDLAAFSMADGGLLGTGLNLGRPDLVPEVQTDFILAAVAEELGLVGATAIIMAFLLLVGSGLRIAQQQATSGFDRLFAVGLTTLMGFQAFIIMGGVTRLLPLTGVTLPFVSYGGSSLLANYMLVALLLRMSDSTARHQAEAQASRDVTQAVGQVG